jgi:hypothetical protein
MRKSRRQPALFLRELITARSQRLKKTARWSWLRALLRGRALAHALVNNSCFDMQEGEMIREMLRDSFIRILRGFHVAEVLHCASIFTL